MSRSALTTIPSEAALADTFVGLGAWAFEVVCICATLIEPPTVPITGSVGRPASAMRRAPKVPVFAVEGVSSSASEMEFADPCRAATEPTLGMLITGTGLFCTSSAFGGASVVALTGDCVRTARASAVPLADGPSEVTSAEVPAPKTPAAAVGDPGGVTASVMPEEEEVAAYLIVVTVVVWAPPGMAAATASASAAALTRAARE
jgi:hypothetical protein